ncbi:MAG: fasciclin domain-containing protein [Caldilinea sp.]|nr:fasciclin domain-containing protein [Caldilinea sp.]MDW8440823.1 fasciclin domain-containing protein [Caldilineaceae bacterium]
MQGSPVTFSIADGVVKVNDATVIAADIEASNGVIHVIDKVILPPSE